MLQRSPKRRSAEGQSGVSRGGSGEPTQPRGTRSALLCRVQALLAISGEERVALDGLERDGTPLLPQTKIINDGAPYGGIGIVKAGWLLRSKTLPDGRRQVINFVLPGDFICLDALTFDCAYYDVCTVGHAVVSRRSVDEIEKLYAEYPRLAAIFKQFAVLEDAMMSERLLSVGRRTAIEAVSHLLLELWHRLKFVGLAGESMFPMPLTQDVIADALGLCAVHVNRTLKLLQNGGLINFEHHKPRSIIVLDAQRLQRLAGFKSRYLQLKGIGVGQEPTPLQASN